MNRLRSKDQFRSAKKRDPFSSKVSGHSGLRRVGDRPHNPNNNIPLPGFENKVSRKQFRDSDSEEDDPRDQSPGNSDSAYEKPKNAFNPNRKTSQKRKVSH